MQQQLAFIAPQITPDAVLDALSRRVGPANGATVYELASEILGRPAKPADERVLRQAVLQLRRQGHAVCSTPDEGYHSAASADDLQRTCLHLTNRAVSSLEQVAAMKRVALPDFYGQLGLPNPSNETEETRDGQDD